MVEETSIPTTTQRTTWLLTSGYFWVFAGIGAYTPYVALYFRELGFSGLQVGILTSLPALATSVTGPIWGALADSLAIHRTLLRVMLVIATLMALVATQPTTFVPFLVIIGILSFALVPVPSLLDSYAITVGERVGRSFGSIRVWGTVGFIVVVMVMGEVMAGDLSSRFLVAYAMCLALAWLSLFTLPTLTESQARPLFDGLQAVKGNWPFLLLLMVAYLLASGAGVLNIFLGIHIEQLGGGTDIVGIAFAVSAISELPVIAFGGWFMTRMGSRRLIVLALAVYAIRFLILSIAPSAVWVIVAQTLHGLSFGAFLVASVPLAHWLVGRENAATAQALLATMSFGFGSISGSLGAGALLDVVGTFTIFRGVSVVMVIALVIFVVGNRFVRIDQHERHAI